MVMNTLKPTPLPADRRSEPQLDHERLHVYQLALELHSVLTTLVPRRGYRVLRDQLERASLSIVLNIAEGAGRTCGPDKRRFYVLARGSTTECAALLDVLRLRALVDLRGYASARSLLVRVVQMLSRLGEPARPAANQS
jgi:four helix bundle protein